MSRIVTKIHFYSSEDGGRSQTLPPSNYGCPVYFQDIAELSSTAYDCRILVNQHEEPITPGDTINELAIAFLSSDFVLPFLKSGVKFKLWESKFIGDGEIVRIEP